MKTNVQFVALQVAYTNGKNSNKQFCSKKLPYWKTTEYKNYIANGGNEKDYINQLLNK